MRQLSFSLRLRISRVVLLVGSERHSWLVECAIRLAATRFDDTHDTHDTHDIHDTHARLMQQLEAAPVDLKVLSPEQVFG